MTFGAPITPCGDCVDGRCTMNCSTPMKPGTIFPKHSAMSGDERWLLLTVARLLRAHMGDHMNHPDFSDIHLDYVALNDALAPFDPSAAPPVNEAAMIAEQGENS